MMSVARNRTLLPGILWGFVLAVLPTLVMAEPSGLTGFLVIAVLFWTAMALMTTDFTLRDPVEPPVLMSPGISPGGLFVSAFAFACTLVGGLLFGPILGPLVERAANKEKELVR